MEQEMSDVVIEFPRSYPIKVIGESVPGFLEQVLEIARQYDATLSLDKVTERPSRKGNYHAITLEFWATGEPQLKALFEDLKTCSAVKMVL